MSCSSQLTGMRTTSISAGWMQQRWLHFEALNIRMSSLQSTEGNKQHLLSKIRKKEICVLALTLGFAFIYLNLTQISLLLPIHSLHLKSIWLQNGAWRNERKAFHKSQAACSTDCRAKQASRGDPKMPAARRRRSAPGLFPSKNILLITASFGISWSSCSRPAEIEQRVQSFWVTPLSQGSHTNAVSLGKEYEHLGEVMPKGQNLNVSCGKRRRETRAWGSFFVLWSWGLAHISHRNSCISFGNSIFNFAPSQPCE